MEQIVRGRPRSKKIRTAMLYCEHHAKECEHREWRRGLDKGGLPRLVWICTQKQNERNKAAYAAKKGG